MSLKEVWLGPLSHVYYEFWSLHLFLWLLVVSNSSYALKSLWTSAWLASVSQEWMRIQFCNVSHFSKYSYIFIIFKKEKLYFFLTYFLSKINYTKQLLDNLMKKKKKEKKKFSYKIGKVIFLSPLLDSLFFH